MKRYLTLTALAVSLGGCVTQPIVRPVPTTVQYQMHTMVDWSSLSVRTAEAIVEKLRTVPDNGAGAHLVDGKPAPSSLAGRPLYLRPSDSTVPFNRKFGELLSLELTRLGEVVTERAAGATVVNYDVTLMAYDHEPERGYLPGTAILITGVTLGVAAAAAANPIGGAFAAAASIDAAREINKALEAGPNTEVVLNVEVKANDQSLFHDVDYFYIDRADAKFYVGALGNYGKPAPMQTGPAAAGPVQTRVVRVTSQ